MCDQDEQNPLVMSHHLLTLVTNRQLDLAPLQSVELYNVLDIGTGT